MKAAATAKCRPELCDHFVAGAERIIADNDSNRYPGVASDPHGINGAVNYTYDAVGNRQQLASTLAPVPAGLWNYDANDRFTAGDTYDNNGNTVSSGGIAAVYDFENHLIQKAGVSIVYDGDGNRVSKTVAGITTTYLVDTLNPTGYAQVVYESFSGNSSGNREQTHSYVYGLDLIAQVRSYLVNFNSITQRIYYVYDGHGSVRALTDSTGAITDTYDYDAFGNLIHGTGTTPNNYLFAGEQFDPDLNLYYNRARYLNVSTGRFWTIDTLEGTPQDPLSLHKYLYTQGSPVGHLDRSGNQIDDVAVEELGDLTLENMATEEELGQTILEEPPPAPAPPPTGPPATIPNAPAPVSFGSLIGTVVVTLTALALASSLVSDNPLPPTQPRSGGAQPLTVYRDASGPSPSDFRIDATRFSTTGFGVSTRQQPLRNQRFIVPFLVIYDGDQPFSEGAIGVVSDPVFVSCIGKPVPIVYSPSEGPGGHWSLQAPADPAEQMSYKQSLAAYGKKVKVNSNSPTP